MKEIDIKSWNRKKQYEWFNTFSNPTYSINKEMDVTNVLKYAKENNKSFFVCFLYILAKWLNTVDKMGIRYVDGKVILYDDINPTYTVMTDSGIFKNVSSHNHDNFIDFYKETKGKIKKIKHNT